MNKPADFGMNLGYEANHALGIRTLAYNMNRFWRGV